MIAFLKEEERLKMARPRIRTKVTLETRIPCRSWTYFNVLPTGDYFRVWEVSQNAPTSEDIYRKMQVGGREVAFHVAGNSTVPIHMSESQTVMPIDEIHIRCSN
jgi:hypothetical protein